MIHSKSNSILNKSNHFETIQNLVNLIIVFKKVTENYNITYSNCVQYCKSYYSNNTCFK